MKLTISQGLQTVLADMGADVSRLFQQAGIPQKLWQEEIELTDLEYYRLLQALDQVLSESDIERLSRIEELQMFVPSFFAALSAKNGLEALERFVRFKKLVGPIQVQVTQSETTVAVHYGFVLPQLDLPKFAILNEQLLLLSLMRTGTGQPVLPLLVESPYDYEPATQDCFGLPVQSNAYNQVVFDKADLERPFVTQNNVMWTYLKRELEHQLASHEQAQTLAGHVQQALFSAIPGGQFLIGDVALGLGLSARSLQRQLKAENTSYQAQVQAVQKAMALSYLKLNVPTEEIAALLGYSEVNAFLRAFKKWTGQTLTAYRLTIL